MLFRGREDSRPQPGISEANRIEDAALRPEMPLTGQKKRLSVCKPTAALFELMHACDGTDAFQISNGPPDQQGDHIVHRGVDQSDHAHGQEYGQPEAAGVSKHSVEEQDHDGHGFQNRVDDGDDDTEYGTGNGAIEDIGVLFQPKCTQCGPGKVGQCTQHDGEGGGQQKAEGGAQRNGDGRHRGKKHSEENGHVGGQRKGAGGAKRDFDRCDQGDQNADGHQQGRCGKTKYIVTAVHGMPP